MYYSFGFVVGYFGQMGSVFSLNVPNLLRFRVAVPLHENSAK